MEGSLEHELKTWSWEPSQIGLGLVLFCLPLMIFFFWWKLMQLKWKSHPRFLSIAAY